MEIGKASQGATRERVTEVFGDADHSGVDDFGEDVLRYPIGGNLFERFRRPGKADANWMMTAPRSDI